MVDNVPEGSAKKKNLNGKKYAEYYDKKDFINKIVGREFGDDIDSIIHMGACSSTTLDDAQYYQTNNFEYTVSLAKYALEKNIRFIYASSAATYGDGSQGYDDADNRTRHLSPLNLYGKSKHDFDLWVLDNDVVDRVVGLKFFNVFGPNEYHKGDMKSVVAKAYDRVVEEGRISLFKSYDEHYEDGEQKRDFIYVKDAVDVVLYFFDHKDINGIFNVGTGVARSWNDIAGALFSAVGKEPCIEYIEMPGYLKDKYQYFTQANMDKLRNAGYSKDFTSLEDAIKDYSYYLLTKSTM